MFHGWNIYNLLLANRARNYWPGCLLLFTLFIYCALNITYVNATEDVAKTTEKNEAYAYYYKGRLVTLNPSNRYIAISTKTKMHNSIARELQLSLSPISGNESVKESKFRIYNLPVTGKDRSRALTIQKSLRAYATDTGTEIQPVFEYGQSLLIASNEIIVGFREKTDLERARQYFARTERLSGVTNVKHHRENTFIVTITNPSFANAFRVSQLLSQQKELRFAEPNLYIIPREIPKRLLPECTPGRSGHTAPSAIPNPDAPVTGPVTPDCIPVFEPGVPRYSDPADIYINWTTLLTADCDGTSLPAGWTTTSNTALTNVLWGTTTYRRHAGERSCYASNQGTDGIEAPGPYPQGASNWLDSPRLDLAGYEEVYVEFWLYAQLNTSDGIVVSTRADLRLHDRDLDTNYNICPTRGDFCFTFLIDGDLTDDETTDNGWRRALIRIPPSLRRDNVNLRFFFTTDNSATSLEGFYIDELRVVASHNVDRNNVISTDPYASRQYGFKNLGQLAGLGHIGNDMNIPEAWEIVSASPDIIVAVIDSGVDLTHPDLNIHSGYDHDSSPGGGPRGAHGTAVAGNIGAIRDNGIGVVGTAPNAPIMSVYRGTMSSENASAIDVAVANGARILNLSWGGVHPPIQDIEDAVNAALAAGRVVLAAVGNGPILPPFTYDVAAPANMCGYTDLICVGASSPTDEHKSTSSSDGSYIWGSSYIGDGPDVVAPSPWSYTTDIQGSGGYNPDEYHGSLIDPSDPDSENYTPTFGGTSSSTPKVAGIVALMLSANPGLTPAEVKQVLRDTADDIDEPGVDDKTGAGRVNAYEAVYMVTPLWGRIIIRIREYLRCFPWCPLPWLLIISIVIIVSVIVNNTFLRNRIRQAGR